MIVCKFGGSSLSTVDGINKAKKIIESNSNRKIIVVSAIGRRFTMDEKVTDLLISLTQIKNKNEQKILLLKIKDRFIDMAYQLKLKNPEKIFNFNQFEDDIYFNNGPEYIISRGEYFTAKMLSIYLNKNFVDASELIYLKQNGSIDYLKTKQKLINIDFNSGVIIPGFYCSSFNEKVTLLGRGGSDTTGAILANLLNASAYENYTDVNGVLEIDNKFYKQAGTLKNLSYGTLASIVKGGAEVYKAEALPPIVKSNIPLYILNTFNHNQFSKINNEKTFGFYFEKPEEYQIIQKIKKVSKCKYLSMILKSFMLDNISYEKIFYTNNNFFIKSKTLFSKTKIDALTLNIFYKNNQTKIKEIRTFCKDKNIKFILNKIPYYKYKIIFFGKINKSFIKKLIYILEK